MEVKDRTDKVILHVIGALVAGGAEKFVIDLLLQMKKKGHNVALFVLSNRIDDAGKLFIDKLENSEISYYVGPTNKVRFRSLYWFFKELNKLRPDYIHLHTPNTELAYYLAGRFYFKSHKLYRTIHSTSVKFNVLSKKAFNGNNVVKSIACGNSTYQAFKLEIKNNLSIIDNGVNFDWPIKNHDNSIARKQILDLNPDKKHFVFVGRLSGTSIAESPKAIDNIISSWKAVGMKSNDAVLHIIGDGNLIHEFRSLAGKDDSIIFHGIRKDVVNWLLACDYFVMPSRYEGLPIAGIEAIGTGIYCIFSKIEPLLELNPPYAMWVENNSIESLSQVLKNSLVMDIEIDLKKIEVFRNKYSIEDVAKRYLNMYFPN